MNRIQRFLLIFFAVLMLFSFAPSSSHSETHLKLFFSAALLFFGLSPVRWFSKEQSLQKGLAAAQPENEKNEEASEDEDSHHLPLLGNSTFEQSLVLKSLIKLRSAEIGSIYRTLRDYQRSAGDGNWVPLFMKRKAVSDLYYAHYVQVEKEEEQKAEAKAQDIFERRYKFCSIAPTDLYEDQIADLQIGLTYWSSHPKMMIQRLEEIKSFGFMIEWIDSLVQKYKLLDQEAVGGNFEKIFKTDHASKSFKNCLERISSSWFQISRIIKMSILMNRVKGNIKNEYSSDEDIDLQEIDALEELERHLDYAITQENLKIKD